MKNSLLQFKSSRFSPYYDEILLKKGFRQGYSIFFL